jgi:hypothetical protein
MKRKTGMALLALSSGLMIVFAAEVDKCTEKFDACKVTCTNQRAQCMARGNTVDSCDNRLKQCNADCAKELKACQAKAPAKPTPKK